MAEEIGVLVATLKLDMSQMRAEFASLQGQLTQGMRSITSALETMGTKGVAGASASATAMTSAIQKTNAESLKQLGIMEAQRVAQNQANVEKVALFNATRIANQSLQNDLEKAAISSQQKILANIEADFASQKAIATKKAQLALDTNDKIQQLDIKSKSAADYSRIQAAQAEEKALNRTSKIQQDYTNNWNNNIEKGRLASELASQKKADAEEKAQARMNKAGEDTHNKTLARISRAVAAIAAIMAARFVLGGIEQALAMGIKFNAEMETARLGVASVISSQGEFINQSGQMATGYTKLSESMKLGDEVIKQLKVDNLSTMATLEQLIRAFQEGLAPAMAAGFNIQQVRQYTVAMVQAAGALRINLDMMGEEVRSLVTGNINPRNSRIAVALGITAEQIRAMKEEPEKLFNYLMGRLDSFRVAGIESQKTFFGLVSNFKDAMSMAIGEGTSGLFDWLKKTLYEIANGIISINQVTGEIKINEAFSATVQNISGLIIGFGNIILLLDKIIEKVNTIGGLLPQGLSNWIMEPINYLLSGEFLKDYDKEIGKLLDKAKYGSDTMKNIIASETFHTGSSPYEFTPNKPFMSEQMKNQVQAEIEQRYAMTKAYAQQEIALFKSSLKTETDLIEEEYSKRNILDVEALTQKSAVKQKEINLEMDTLEKEKEALISNFKERADYLKNPGKYQQEPTGVFKNQEEMVKAEKAMSTAIIAIDTKLAEAQGHLYQGTIETNIALRQKQRDMDIVNLKQILDLYEILINKRKEEINIGVVKEEISDYSAKKQNLQLELESIDKRLELARAEQQLKLPDTETKRLELENKIYNLAESRINLEMKGQTIEAENTIKLWDTYIAMNKEIAELSHNYDEIYETELDILAIEEARAKLAAGDNSASQAAIRQLYALKEREAYMKTEEARMANLQPVFQGAESLFSTTGNEAYLNYYKSFIGKIIELTKDKNKTLFQNEEERRIVDLAAQQGYYDKLYQMELTRSNKQYEAYSKLYKATGKQEYYDRLIQIENQILDKEDYFNNQIVDTEQAGYDLRMIRMQEFQNSRLDMVQQNANQEIGIAKQTTNALLAEQQRMSNYWSTLNWGGTGSLENFMGGSGGNDRRTITYYTSAYFPGIQFADQQTVKDWESKINKTSMTRQGLYEVTGPAAGGGSQWFNSLEDAQNFIKNWTNNLGQATVAQTNLTSSTNDAARALEDFQNKVKSSYQSYQSFVTERERKNWGATEWTNEFDRLADVFKTSTDPLTQLDTLDLMLDAIKKLDDIQQQALQTQKQLANDLLSSAKSVDELINSLKFGQMNPGASWQGIENQFTTLKDKATTVEGVNALNSFIQNTYLPFMKTYGSGYFDRLKEVTDVLGTISEDLKGKAAYISLATALGIDLNIKLTKSDIFDFSQLTAVQLSWFTDTTTTGYSLFEKMGTWTAQQMYLFGALATNSLFTKEGDWNAEKLYFWTNVIDKSKDDKWMIPETISFWNNVIDKSKDDRWMKPEILNFWANVISKTADTKWMVPETVEFWTNVIDKSADDKWMKPEIVAFWTNVIDKSADDKWMKPEIISFWNNVIDKSADTKWMQPETVDFWSNVVSKVNIKDWKKAETVDFWANVVQIVNPDMWKKPKDINFWTNVVTLGTWTPETVNLWNQVTDQSVAFKLGTWEPKLINISDIATITGTLSLNIAAGNLPGVTENIQSLIDILGSSADAGTLAKAVIDSAGKVNILSTNITGTETPFNDMSRGVADMVLNVKSQLKTVGDLFDALANQMGINFGAEGLVQAVQKINTQTVNTTTYKEPIYVDTYSNGTAWYYVNPITGLPVFLGTYGPFESHPIKMGPFYPPKGLGGLTSGPSLAGELGPEYVVPTYEPQRSNFLRSVGVDTPEIGREIAKQLSSCLTNTSTGSGSNNKEMHFHININGKEIADVIASELYNGNASLVKNTRRAVTGRY